MTKHRPAFPRALISFINLQGQNGTLDVIARDEHTVELSFADSDFVALKREQWAALRAAVDPLFGFGIETVVIAEDSEGEPLVLEEQEPVVTRRRRSDRKARPSA